MSADTTDDDLNRSMADHPAGKRGRRPGVRLVELRPAVTEQMLVDLAWIEQETQPAVRVLECISCGALLAPGSPLATTHVEGHRGAWWRHQVRDARIRWHRWRRETLRINAHRCPSSLRHKLTAHLRMICFSLLRAIRRSLRAAWDALTLADTDRGS